MTGKYEYMFNPKLQTQTIGIYNFLKEKYDKIQELLNKR